ncbi:unnamed protein product [Cylindrotheca closterium]|uniref:DUF6824 domain-containing protein n=1 Tax=Cylindrotheca closterium TaxID=2856 RepID=A0AAD2PTX4_9STRA|nr:unnamed protein product [Cylindrotheca closterium]
MASSSQHHEWYCRPRQGDHQQQRETDSCTAPVTLNRKTYNYNGRSSAMQPTEEIVASELSKLSVQERAQAFDDIHCVGEEMKETPEMVRISLAEFEEIVKKEHNIFYEIAMTQDRTYVEDPSFRLKFLRANIHHVGKSVRQMMNFLQHKAAYFGNDKIAREITLDDLNEEDKACLLSGFCYIQEGRDRAGRTVIHWFGSMLGRFKAENLIRAAYILWMVILLPDPVVQTKGVVTVYHNASRTGEEFVMPGMKFIRTLSNVTSSFPFRYSAMHFCLLAQEGKFSPSNSFLGSIVKTLPVYSKVRSRIHVGSIMELQYALRSHGIPTDIFPVDPDGSIRDDVVLTWFYKQYQRAVLIEGTSCSTGHAPKLILTQEDKTPFIPSTREPIDHIGHAAVGNWCVPFAVQPSDKPTENDILLGRGRITQLWPGNIKFREFLEKHSVEYDMLPRTARKKRTVELTQELGAKGIRFFEPTGPGKWVEIDSSEARKKVSQLFRTFRKNK